MGRRKHRVKREYSPDPVFGRVDVTRFINHIMRDGKKAKAQKIFYKAMEIVEKKTKQKAIDIYI